MKYNPRLLAFLLLIAVLFSGGCGPREQGCSFGFSNTWTIEHLDNSGAAPEPSDQDISSTAYGLRVSNIGPVATGGHCDYYYATSYVNSVRIFTRRPFKEYPAGSDISHQFVVRTQSQPSNYLSVDNAVDELFSPKDVGAAIRVDFLLLNGPEKPDSCQFDVVILLTKTIEIDPFGIDTIISGPSRTDSILIDLKTTPVYLK